MSSPYFSQVCNSLWGYRLSHVLTYFSPPFTNPEENKALLQIYFIRVGNVLQKSINQQILMVVCLWVLCESVLSLLQMQCIFFLCTGTCRMTEVSAEHHTIQELDTDFATVTWPSSLWLQYINNFSHSQASNFKKWKNKLFWRWILKNRKAGYRTILVSQWCTDILQILRAVVVIPSPVNMIMFQNSETYQNHLKSRSVIILLHKMENEKLSGFPFWSWIYLM